MALRQSLRKTLETTVGKERTEHVRRTEETFRTKLAAKIALPKPPKLAVSQGPNQAIADLDALALRHGTDKSSAHHNYVRHYGRYYAPFRASEFSFLELGIKDGASLRMWKEFFPSAHIIGIDNREVSRQYAEPGIDVHVGLQQDHDFLASVAASSPLPIRLILDDASHHNLFSIESFRGLFHHLAPGGIYAIEDLHCSYEEHGMFDNRRDEIIDFLTELTNAVDINGRRDVYSHVGSAQDFAKLDPDLLSKLGPLERWVESVHYHQGIMFIRKRPA